MLQVENLASGYGRIPILAGVTLTVQQGEVVGVLGHNGMGKTTLLKTIMGFIPATAGAVRFDGEDISREPAFVRARLGLGYVPQGREIFPRLSVLGNLHMGAASAARSRAGATAIVESVLEDFASLRPLLDRQGGTLSGGEQQILAIARALCARPKLILLDEPTEGIQPSMIERIADTLERLRASRSLTLVLVEQNLEFLARLAQRVFVIQRGVIVNEIDGARLLDAGLVGEVTAMDR